SRRPEGGADAWLREPMNRTQWCPTANRNKLYPRAGLQQPSWSCRRGSMTQSAVSTVALVSLVLTASRAAADPVRYSRDIRPILPHTCCACHGPDSAARKAKLRLDVRDVAVAKGAIVPGKPDESKLVARVFSADAADLMPPPKAKKPLTSEEKEALKRWIAAG